MWEEITNHQKYFMACGQQIKMSSTEIHGSGDQRGLRLSTQSSQKELGLSAYKGERRDDHQRVTCVVTQGPALRNALHLV